ncbi:MAG: MoaD/ThiS family protein [Spirochaetaceae bacterium]|nr:MAG: MoaD/ThiS family protein [Spirochaetaceae bacterium]
MTVRIRGLGPFRGIFGEQAQSIILSSGDRLKDLIRAIQEKWSELLPSHLWDHEYWRARRPVVIMVEGTRVTDLNTPLKENQEVLIMKVSAGG